MLRLGGMVLSWVHHSWSHSVGRELEGCHCHLHLMLCATCTALCNSAMSHCKSTVGTIIQGDRQRVQGVCHFSCQQLIKIGPAGTRQVLAAGTLHSWCWLLHKLCSSRLLSGSNSHRWYQTTTGPIFSLTSTVQWRCKPPLPPLLISPQTSTTT